MKTVKFILASLIILYIQSCITSTVDIKQYTIKGHLINVNNPLKFAGMRMYLESQTYSIGQGTVIKTIAETTASDSGRFTLIYDSDKGTEVTIKCIEMSDFSARFSSNININSDFFLGDSMTLKISLKSMNPIAQNDTLLIKYLIPNVADNTFLTLLGPITSNHVHKIRCLKGSGITTTWGRGLNDLNRFGDQRYKTFFPLKGDPFIDSVIINY